MKTYRIKGLLLGLAAGVFVFTGTAFAHHKGMHHRHHHMMTAHYQTCGCMYRECYDHWPEMMKDDPRYHREDEWRDVCGDNDRTYYKHRDRDWDNDRD